MSEVQGQEATFICKSVDMSEELKEATIRQIIEAIAKYPLESEVATVLKKTMDTKFGECWHCIVGASFGSFVSHSNGYFIYGDIEYQGVKKSILLFKTD